jgi:hypothetical protein
LSKRYHAAVFFAVVALVGLVVLFVGSAKRDRMSAEHVTLSNPAEHDEGLISAVLNDKDADDANYKADSDAADAAMDEIAEKVDAAHAGESDDAWGDAYFAAVRADPRIRAMHKWDVDEDTDDGGGYDDAPRGEE